MQLKHVTILLVLWFLIGCHGAGDEAAPHEDEAAHAGGVRGVVHLAADAQVAIGLETQTAARQPMPHTLEAHGWLVTPPGQEAVVKASTTGFYQPVSETTLPEVGAIVSRGDRLGTLQVFVSPQEESQLVIAKEEADVVMNQALVSKRLAEEQLVKLEGEGATSAVAGTRLIDLREIVQRNQVAYEEARERLPCLPSEPYAGKLELRAVPVDSPITGRITEFQIAPRQLVVQGDPLWTIADWSTLWVRVPVFEGDVPQVLPGIRASISIPGTPSIAQAVPIAAPQPTAPGRRTVDMFYRLDNSGGQLRPGQPISIGLPLGETREQVVVPRSAVVWDGMGNTWVYVKEDLESFRRQRIELGPGDVELVSVVRGVNEGEEIVVSGVQSLYGEEFKEQLQAGDDD